MSIMDNIRGVRDGDEPGGGKYNPFRILEIGESMVRYCDGIRIKNYNFLAILTSDRLVLIESAQQSAGTIAKEIPVSMIQGAVLERDEKNRPALAISMEVGGQSRLMRLVFTGLIDEPETECREWFAAINGYSPEPEEKPEPEPVPEPAPLPTHAPVVTPPAPPVPPSPVPSAPVSDAEILPPSPAASPVIQALPVQPVPEPVIPAPVPTPAPIPEPAPEIRPDPALTPTSPPVDHPVKTLQKSMEQEPVLQGVRPRIQITPHTEDSIQICVEKPDITPIQMERKILPAGAGSGKTRYCMHCGVRIPASARFCPVCGKNQV